MRVKIAKEATEREAKEAEEAAKTALDAETAAGDAQAQIAAQQLEIAVEVAAEGECATSPKAHAQLSEFQKMMAAKMMAL